MFDPNKQPWWQADAAHVVEAYYMTMRVKYQMPALEAWLHTRNAMRDYPCLLDGFIGTVRATLSTPCTPQ